MNLEQQTLPLDLASSSKVKEKKEKLKVPKTNLREYDWPDIIGYFTLLPAVDKFTAKDLVDYFHFKYLNKTGLERWTTPNYRTQKSCATKLMRLYGKEMSIHMIDILFKKHKDILGKDFRDIIWSLGLLSSDKTGWILERIFNEFSKEKKDFISQLLKKPRKEWTTEEHERFQEYIEGNGG